MTKETRIAEMKQKGDLNGLVKIIRNDDEWISRMDAAKALAQLGDKRGLNYLIHALNDTDTNIQNIAREILEGLNDPRGNQALRQPRKRDTVHSEPDNDSTSHVIDKGINKKAARSETKRMQRNHESVALYARAVLIIIVIAGILIFIDSNGEMNGFLSMFVVILAVFALIIVSALALIANLSRSRNRENNSRSPGNQFSHTTPVTERITASPAPDATETAGKPPAKSSSSSLPPNWEKRLPILVPIIFSFVSVLIVGIYSIRTRNEYMITNSDIFTMTMSMSCLAIPISALIGAVSVWVFFKIRDRR